jgi:WD40 repeat protein
LVLVCRADQPTELRYAFIIQQGVLRRYSLHLHVDKSAVAFRGGLLAVGTQDGGVRVVDVLGGFRTIREIVGTGGPVTALAFDAESDAVFVARGSQVHLWSPEQPLRRLYRLTGEIRLMVGTPGAAVAIAFQSRGSRIVSSVTLVPARGQASRLRFDGLVHGTPLVLTGAASNGRELSFTRTNLEVNRVELLTCEVPMGRQKRPREESPMLDLR